MLETPPRSSGLEWWLLEILPALRGFLDGAGPSDSLLHALTSHTPSGVFLSDADGACRFVNERWCELAGLSFEQAIGDGWVEALHPEDRERVAAEWQVAAAEQRESVISYRFQRPDGSTTWIDGYASAFHDQDGSLVGWVGSCVDLTAYHAAQVELERERELFSVAFEAGPIGVALVDLEGRYVRANEALCRLLGYSREELLELSISDVTHPDDFEADRRVTRELVAGEVDRFRLEKRFLQNGGATMWGSVSVSLVRDEHGEPLHFVAHIEDIGERKEAEQELRHLAERDPLTGLLNRRSFERELGLRLRDRRLASAFLLLVDVDRFKSVNDTYGHQAGDAALRAVGSALRRRARAGDIVARLGGDEFAVLADTGSPSATAKGLLTAVRTAHTGVVGGPLTASIGVAGAEPSSTPSTLFEAADRALYAAKRSGRDRHALDPSLLAVA
jgi:diguanylate cyclase (GGDEF)-like protein/PAS domain S-box-containing protein